MTPFESYQQKLAAGEITEDAQQLAVMQQFEKIYQKLLIRRSKRLSKVGKIRYKIKPRKPIGGLYLWGSVGIGKTYLMDVFYDCFPDMKIRAHFFRFMQNIHEELTKMQGKPNPLQIIAKNIAKKTLLICFDEFFVSNITDAMILAELFTHLFEYGVTLVASSNQAPDDLYKHGLQRQRFLPAIELIKQHTEVMHLDSCRDYRLEHVRKAGVYYSPLNEQAESNMEKSFIHFSGHESVSTEAIQLFGRVIRIRKQANGAIWFDFKAICGRPRSQKDYLELSKHYHTILISNIPLIDPKQPDIVVSFINLIDVLYDAHIRVVISAAASVENIYTGEYQAFEFQRTKSRLIEMQSEEYIYRIESKD